MDRWILGLLAGLVGGAGGALTVHWAMPRTEGASVTAEADGALLTRLDRIERALAPSRGEGPALEARAEDTLAARLARIEALLGAAKPGPGGLSDPATVAALRQAVGAELEARMEALEAKTAAAKAAKPAEPAKKRVALADAARELELTSAEEAEVRKIYSDTQEKMMKLVAGPDGDVEAVRRDVEEAKRDPKKRNVVMAKYMPRLLPKLGDFMTLEMEKQTALGTAVGPDKAARLESEFDVAEDNPLGGDNELRVEAGSRR